MPGFSVLPRQLTVAVRSLGLVQKSPWGFQKRFLAVKGKTEEEESVIDWSKQPVADYVGTVSEDGFRIVGTCHGTSHLKAEPDPPMYERRYYPDWLFEIPRTTVPIDEMDPTSVEYDRRVRTMRIRHQHNLMKQGIPLKRGKK